MHDLVNIEGPAPGNSTLNTSLRSEAYGLLAGITFLNLFIQTHKVNIPINRTLHCFSDNLGLVKWLEEIISNRCYPRMYLRAKADVMLQIEHELQIAKQLNLNISIEHVKGHQDDFLTFHELSRQAQLNVRADSFATNYLQNGCREQYVELTNNPVSIYIAKNVIIPELSKSNSDQHHDHLNCICTLS